MLAAILLSGCAHPGYVEIAELCGDEGREGAWSLITVSKADVLTKRTATDILGTNAAHSAVCKEK